MPGSSLASILQQAGQALASLPAPLVYAGGAALTLVTILLATRIHTSSTTSTAQHAAPSQQSPSPPATDDTAPDDTTTATREPATATDSQEANADSTVTTEPEPPAAADEPASDAAPQEQQPPADPATTHHEPLPTAASNPQPPTTPNTTSKERSRGRLPGRLSSPARRSRSVTPLRSLRRELRRHLIDPFQLETGIDPVALDPSWGLVKADLDLTGASVDTGYELIYLNLQPAPVSYEAIDSPVELTVPTLIRRLLRNAGAASSTDTQPGDTHTTHDPQWDTQQTGQPQAPRHHQDVDNGQQARGRDTGQPNQQPEELVQDPGQRLPPSSRDRPMQDRGLDPDDAGNPAPEPNPWPRDSIDEPAPSSPATNEQPGATKSREQPAPTTQRFDGHSPFKDHFNDPLRDLSVEPGREPAGSTPTPDQQTEHRSAPVDLQPPQWEPPTVEPPEVALPTLAIDDNPLPGAPTIEEATPPRDPFAAMQQGLDAIGVGTAFEEPSNPAMGLGWEDESRDPAPTIFGGETGGPGDETTPLFDATVDEDPLPLWDGGDDRQEDLFDIDLRL